jgi:hypothetical protein
MSEYEDDTDVDLDDDNEIDIEIEDDTPEEDRGRPRRAESEEADTFPKKGMILILKSTASLCKSVLKSLNLSIMKNGVGKKRQTESVKRHFSTRIRLKARTNGFAKT